MTQPCRHPKAQQHLAAYYVRIGIALGLGSARRRYVIEKAAPFVKGYYEDCALPVWTLSEGVERLGQERIPALHVAVGMIVIRGIEIKESKPRVDKGDGGQRSASCVIEELLVGCGNPEVLQPPEGQNWDIRESSRSH